MCCSAVNISGVKGLDINKIKFFYDRGAKLDAGQLRII